MNFFLIRCSIQSRRATPQLNFVSIEACIFGGTSIKTKSVRRSMNKNDYNECVRLNFVMEMWVNKN